MPIRLLYILASACCGLVFLLPVQSSSAEPSNLPDIEALLSRANSQRLSHNPEWLTLLHFHSTLWGGFESQVDDERFFLSRDGKNNPQSELNETIKQVFSTTDLSNSHPRCKFVARYYWLADKLDVSNTDTSACSEYHEWLTTINPKSAVLVFPAAYLNSPSSMFGHTLLRLDPDDYRNEIPLASYAINYAAQLTGHDNEFLYAYRGLFGGYPGNFNIVPYHAKIKEYSDLENRDIWEYSLDLSATEILRMMRHLWELKSIRFDYFFTSENCSYRLLSLIDVARPGLNLNQQFGWRTMPVDTIRAVLNTGMVRKFGYRPSQTKILLHRFNTLPENLQNRVRILSRSDISLDDQSTQGLSDIETAQILELSYDFIRYQATSVVAKHKPQYQKSYLLLKQRSSIAVDKVWPETNIPEYRSDQAHGSSRYALAYGSFRAQHYLSFQYRPAYHQQLDPDIGMDYGAAINFFNFDVRYQAESKSLELNNFNVLNIESLTPVNGLFSPWSWAFNLENRKTAISDYQIFNITQLNAGVGKTYALNDTNKSSLSFLLDNQAYANSKLSKKIGIGLGPRFLFRANIARYAFFTDLSWRKTVIGEPILRKTAYVGVSKFWTTNASLRLHYRRELWENIGSSEWEISAHYYF